MVHEVELKLLIRPEDVARLRRHPAIRSVSLGKPVTRKLTSIYYDTPQLALLDAGLSLRVRHMSGGWFQAVKATGSSLAGLHQRMEWEHIIAFGHPDFSKITDPALTKIFDDPALRADLAPIFVTETQRTDWLLAWENGDKIELALDLGQLIIGNAKEPISEIELELKQGSPARLFELALALQADIPLWIENASKAQRGYAHYMPQPPVIAKACPKKLNRAMSAGEALKQIAWECLSHLQGNQDMVLHGEDIEGVHQMRVALRRLRSAFSLFRSEASKRILADIIGELRWITDILGSARDLDVFTTETLPPLLEQLHDRPCLLQLRDRAAEARQRAYIETRAALSSQRYQRLLLTLGAWLENGQEHDANTVELGVRDLARTMLAKRYRQLRKHGRQLMHAHPEERHATRIAAKKLRYAVEFFSSLYAANKSRSFMLHLIQLQDILGVLNDIVVTENLLDQLAAQHPSRAMRETIAIFTGWNACQAGCRLEHMDKVWRDFVHGNPFWD